MLDYNALDMASPEEKRALARLAIGRLFLLGSRPHQEGDDEAYAECRAVLIHITPKPSDVAPNYARQGRGGAQGD